MQSEVRIGEAEEVVEGRAGVEEAEVVSLAVPSQAVREEDPSLNSAIKAPNIRICHQESGKDVISTDNGGGGLIFVLSLPPAPGKMYSRQDNETGTSPVRVHQNQ